LGFKLDDAANQAAFRGKSGNISSGVAALVINTDEEWLIAQDTALIAAQ
jgi:acetate kinase